VSEMSYWYDLTQVGRDKGPLNRLLFSLSLYDSRTLWTCHKKAFRNIKSKISVPEEDITDKVRQK